MKLFVNGKEDVVDVAVTVQEYLLHHGHDPNGVAVAINEEFLPRTLFDQTHLQDGDSVEVVAPMQGG